jgi:hypothetical protein
VKRGLCERLVAGIIALAKRDPYFHLPGYMERYWILRPHRWLPISIRVHHILRSDLDRHLHDHPWRYATIILRGGYWEERPIFRDALPLFAGLHAPAIKHSEAVTRTWHAPGALLRRQASDRHRLILPKGTTAWTLFFMGPRCQEWGFYTEHGKVAWEDYLDGGEVAEQKAQHAHFGIPAAASYATFSKGHRNP